MFAIRASRRLASLALGIGAGCTSSAPASPTVRPAAEVQRVLNEHAVALGSCAPAAAAFRMGSNVTARIRLELDAAGRVEAATMLDGIEDVFAPCLLDELRRASFSPGPSGAYEVSITLQTRLPHTAPGELVGDPLPPALQEASAEVLKKAQACDTGISEAFLAFTLGASGEVLDLKADTRGLQPNGRECLPSAVRSTRFPRGRAGRIVRLYLVGHPLAMGEAFVWQAPDEAAQKSERSGRTSMNGGLSREVIGRVIREAWPRTKACFEAEFHERHLEDEYRPAGRVSTRFTIGPSGGVRGEVHIEENTLPDSPPMAACVENVVRELAFPAPADGMPVEVSYPFNVN